MIFLEEDVDAPPEGRLTRWFEGYNQPGDVYLPLVMVDSGDQVSNGDVDFDDVYSDLIDTSMARPAAARMAVEATRVGDVLHFEILLKNTSGTTLSAANAADLTALVYLEPTDPNDLPAVLRSNSMPIPTLTDGATAHFVLEVGVVGLSQSRIRWVVIADYRPAGLSGKYDMLQAVQRP